jgi:hypothetical protein
MDDLIGLINHLINAKYSIDRIDSISDRLNISREQILRILRADRYKDYFQLLKNKNQGTEKIALTLDVSFSIKKQNQDNLFVEFSSSVVHIMLNNVKINPVRFCIYVLTTSDQCMENVQIKHVHTIMKF